MKVLVADDDPVSRTRLVALISKWGYEAIPVADGIAAWSVLDAEGPPPLALLDWMMPGLSGTEICRRLRARGAEPYVYVILLTGRDSPDNLVEGLSAGADDYLSKPFRAPELELRLRAGRRLADLYANLERRVAARTAELQDLYDNAPCGYHSLGSDGTFLRMNTTLPGWLGYPREELIGRRFADFLTPASALSFEANLRALGVPTSSEAYGEFEYEMIRKDGATRWLRFIVTIVRDHQGRYVKSRSASIDVTEHRRAEQGLRERDAEVVDFLHHTGDSIYFADVEGRIVYANPALCEAFGYAVEEVLRITLFDLLRPEEHAEVRRRRALTMSRPEPVSNPIEHELLTRTGGSLHVEGTASPRIQHGRCTGTYVVLHDVSARRHAEAALRRAKDHAEAASHAKSAFLANMSHEIPHAR